MAKKDSDCPGCDKKAAEEFQFPETPAVQQAAPVISASGELEDLRRRVNAMSGFMDDPQEVVKFQQGVYSAIEKQRWGIGKNRFHIVKWDTVKTSKGTERVQECAVPFSSNSSDPIKVLAEWKEKSRMEWKGQGAFPFEAIPVDLVES